MINLIHRGTSPIFQEQNGLSLVTDEVEIGVTYDQLDRVLASAPDEERKDPIDPAAMERISSLIAASEHKRRPIPMFRRDAVDISSRR